jgi:hypothetical protein
MRKFEIGDRVILRSDELITDMKTGDAGIVVNWYAVDPPAYEVRFRRPNGREFDVLLMEEELDIPPQGDASAHSRP